jgi:hypothetical protein
MDQLKVSNYDLTCLGINACPPEDFQALIQLLITKICELNGITPTEVKSSGCPDCVVSVAPCFIEGTQTTMQLVDYVQMIANRICSILDQIDIINNQITNLDIRVTVLENTPPPTFTLPSIDTGCLSEYLSAPYTNLTQAPIDTILNTLVNDSTIGYCALIAATDLPANILSAVATQCITGTDDSLANPGDTFSSAYGPYTGFGTWNDSPVTAADAINNLWIALCDMYDYLSNLNVSITTQDTTSINLDYTSNILTAKIQDTGWVELNGFDFYSGVDKPQCRRIGNQIHFRGLVVVPLPNPVSPTNPANYTATSYNSITSPTTFSGTGGCYINTNGSIVFNNDISVIKTSVVDTLTNFDGTYTLGWVVATRQIDLGGGYGTALSALLSVGIASDKKLYAAVLKDLEYTSTVQNPAQLGSSHLRYITSNVLSGQEVPNFLSPNTQIHSANIPGGGTLAVDVEYNSFTYPFSCNAGLETQIGGFVFRLDGLIAYLDPCNSDIKNKVCP